MGEEVMDDDPTPRDEVRRLNAKLDRLQKRLTDIERANVDRWKDGYAAAERQIAAWLRDGASTGHWPEDASEIADAIERGEHRPLNRENE